MPPTCDRCGAEFHPDEAEGWVVLDAREDGWTLIACPECQTAAERQRFLLLLDQ
jgi:hypothetical protein